MLWSLLALVPVLAIAYVVWIYRRRFAAKEAASRERLALLLGDKRAGPAATAGTAPARGATGVPAAAPALRRLFQPGPHENGSSRRISRPNA